MKTRFLFPLLLLVASVASAQNRPLSGTTITATDTSSSALMVGCAVGTTTGCTGTIQSGKAVFTSGIAIDGGTISDAGIVMPSGVPSVTTMALYNDSGTLKFNGVTLATGASVSGTVQRIPFFTASNAIGDSIMIQDVGATTITLTGLLATTTATVSSTLGVTGVATFTAAPVFSSATASLPMFTDGSKGLTSNSMTGTGSVAMSNSPTFITPALGTPASGVLTNATGLPVSTGISGLGTGVATALAVNVGSAGAPVTFNGAGGTPSSMTGTNITGIPAAGVTGTAAVLTGSTFTGTTAVNAVFTVAPTTNVSAFLVLPSFATYEGNAIYVNTTRAANAAFSLMSLNANAVSQFLVTGDGTLAWGGGSAISSSSNVALLDAVNTFTALGTHSFSAGGTGFNRFDVRNTTAGASNGAQINAGNDSDAQLTQLIATSSTYTPSGEFFASGSNLRGNGAGGLSVTATDPSGDVRIYSRNALAATFGASQAATLTGTLTVSGFGTHSFTSTATAGYNAVTVANPYTAGAGGAYLRIHGGATDSYIASYNASASGAGITASSLGIEGLAAGGVSLQAQHASGDVRIYSRNALAATFGASQAATFTGAVELPNIRMIGTGGLFLGSTVGSAGDTYIYETVANVVRVVAGGVAAVDIRTAASISDFYSDLSIAGGKKFYYDSGGDTYATEVVANTIRVVAGGSGGVDLTSGATAWAAVSDFRLKTDLTPISSASWKLAQLRAVTGRYTADATDTRRSFLIAQDVQAVLPEAVTTGADGFLTLRYTDVIPLLVAGASEAHARLTAIEARLGLAEYTPIANEAQKIATARGLVTTREQRQKVKTDSDLAKAEADKIAAEEKAEADKIAAEAAEEAERVKAEADKIAAEAAKAKATLREELTACEAENALIVEAGGTSVRCDMTAEKRAELKAMQQEREQARVKAQQAKEAEREQRIAACEALNVKIVARGGTAKVCGGGL